MKFLNKILVLTAVFGWGGVAYAQETEPHCEATPGKMLVEVFVRDNCSHCAEEENFLNRLILERDDVEVHYHDVGIAENKDLLIQLAELEGLTKNTPITLVGDNVIAGFNSAKETYILDLLDTLDKSESKTIHEFLAQGGSTKVTSAGDEYACSLDAPEECSESPTEQIPFLGKVDLEKYPLWGMAAVLGFLDGFNPCAMWVLISFLVILTQIGNRKRMWQVAGLFILAEAIMYYLILNVWLTTWDFIGLDNLVTPLVGLIAIGAGVYFLWEWGTSDGSCQVTTVETRSRIKKKISNFAMAEMTIATVLGILGLAFSVNVIEFACSAGYPQTFTKALELNQLNWLTEQLVTLWYILFYMLDDLVVFAIALYGIEHLGVVGRYSRFTNFVGGVLMIALGCILIFEPGWLVF